MDRGAVGTVTVGGHWRGCPCPDPRRMCEPCKPDALLEAVRGLRVAEPELGFKPLLAKLREQQPDLGAGF